MLRLVIVLVIVAAGAAPAYAGHCDTAEQRATLKRFERYGADATAGRPEVWGLCLDAIVGTPPLAKQLLAACVTILAHDKAFRPCVERSIWLGATKAGAVDLGEAVRAAIPIEPLQWGTPAVALYTKLGDGRGVDDVVAAWKATAPDRRTKRSPYDAAWERWRREAAAYLGRFGHLAERELLSEQLASTKEAGVKKAIKKAIAAIDKRLQKVP